MRPVRALTIYLLAVFVGGGLLAPWFYWAANGTGILDPTTAPPFHRFVNRSLLIVAFAGLWPLAYYCGLDTWRSIGLKRERGWLKDAWKGFLLGFLTLGVVAAGAVLSRSRVLIFNGEFGPLASALAIAAGTAVLVSFLEELLFRGVVFSALRQIYHWSIALLASSGLYSIVHFFQKPTHTEDVTWTSGLEFLPMMLRGFVDSTLVVPGFVVLLLAGAVLAAVYQRRGTLFFSIGVHAGWIFWLKSYGALTRRGPAYNESLWGSGKITDGWMAALVLLLTLVVVVWWRGVPLEPGATTATLGNIEAARRVHRRELAR
jgi:membrane protease YdiL (CAAX protease family)